MKWVSKEELYFNKCGITFPLHLDKFQMNHGMESEKLLQAYFPESDWTIFKAKGPLPTSLQNLNAAVWQDWYPNEGQAFLPNGVATVEFYSAGDPTSDNYEVGIWIPVIKK